MNPKTHTIRTHRGKKRGFALIVTLSIMVLLTLVAVGLLSLSIFSLRSSSHGLAMAEAKANARMALMIALGELQGQAGADTRVTAPADALAGSKGPSQLTGVWRSWEGNDHDKSTGLPVQPDYDSKTKQYSPGSSGRFLTWLISGADAEGDPTSPPDLKRRSDTVPLVAEGSLGAGSDSEVHLVPTKSNDTGAYAWWIQGQNSKALMKEPNPEPEGNEEWSRRMASHGLPDPSAFGFDDPEELGKVVSLETFDLVSNSSTGEKASMKNFHNMTSFSRGLLTNTANGGWRRDLSLMAEAWRNGDVPSRGLPVFSLEPFSEEKEASLRLSNSPRDASVYPWVTADNTAMSWNALLDYVSLYKKVLKHSATGEPYFDVVPTNDSDWVSILPVMARLHLAFGYDAVQSGQNYTPRLLIKPSVTMWNPYNVALDYNLVSLLHIKDTAFPIEIFAKVGSQAEAKIDMGELLGNKVKSGQGRYQMSGNHGAERIMKPGESLMFGKPGNIEGTSTSWNWLDMEPGFSINGSMKIALSNGGAVANGKKDDKISYRWSHRKTGSNVTGRLDYYWSRNRPTPDGTSVRLDFKSYNLVTPSNTADDKIPLPSLVNDNQTLGSAAEEDSPFLVMIIGLRTLVNEYADPSVPAKVHTKGYINTKQIVPGVALNEGVSVEDNPYVWELYAPNSWEDPFMPQSDDAASYGNTHSSYVGTSFQSGFGLNRWAIAELPTQPLLSLGELQHFDISFQNQVPPRVANAVGNSHASPHIDSSKVKGGNDFSYDHSYASNHVLFDDWFLSSITPDVEAFTQRESRSIKKVYEDHLTLGEPLRNQRYLPANPVPAEVAGDIAKDHLDREMAWHDIAAEIEVEGMFNINSTSVEAWKAVLLNQRDTQVPYTSVNPKVASGWSTELEETKNTVVSRATVAGDPKSAADSDVATVATHVTMTDGEVGALAEGIVDQIKQRGPFLSLSEFVNRRLSNDDDLAMGGAIETALMKLAESSLNNPYKEIQSIFPEQATLPSDASAIFKYPKAAVGYAAYGMPGWPRQADILRPLAPIISARDDTFVIRAYGDARNAGSGEVIASTWCEAVVQRRAAYVDAVDASTEYSDLNSTVNEKFGRRFEVVSFRWLSQSEI